MSMLIHMICIYFTVIDMNRNFDPKRKVYHEYLPDCQICYLGLDYLYGLYFFILLKCMFVLKHTNNIDLFHSQ